MKTYLVKTNNYPLTLSLDIECKFPCRIRIIGYSANHPDTKYFDIGHGGSQKPFQGRKTFRIPLPLSPKLLYIKIINEGSNQADGIILHNIVSTDLPNRGAFYTGRTRDFINLAKSFVEKAGYLRGEGEVYEYKDEMIAYSPQINDTKGNYIETPARIGRTTGVMECSKKHFKGYTIPMRMFILCHEWGHYIQNTRDEFQADYFGLKMYLDMGFPKIEAIYSLTKVFDNPSVNEEQVHRARKVLDMIQRI